MCYLASRKSLHIECLVLGCHNWIFVYTVHIQLDYNMVSGIDWQLRNLFNSKQIDLLTLD